MADEKAEARRNITGTTLAGAGAVTAGTGLAAGGVPGARSDFSSVFRVKPGTGKGARKAASTVRGAAPAAKATPGGILGFRLSAHKGGTAAFKESARRATKSKAQNNSDAFFRSRNVGKIPAETKVMRSMTRGRHAANAALVGGSGLTAYGLHHRKKEVSKRDRDTDTYNSALLGAGSAGAAISHGGSKILSGQQRKYEASASRNVDEAGKLVPTIAGREGKKLTLKQMHRHKTKNPGQPFPKTMYPTVTDKDIKSNPKLLGGVSQQAASQAGYLRGKATQERHFAEVYGNTSKVVRRFRTPSAIAAGAGAGGLMVAGSKKDESKVRKSMGVSAFGVEHGDQVSKAMPKIPKPSIMGNKVKNASQSARGTANAFTSGAAGVRQGAGRTTGAQGAGYRAGAGLRRNFRPIAAGTAGAGAGGAAGYSMNRNRQRQY